MTSRDTLMHTHCLFMNVALSSADCMRCFSHLGASFCLRHYHVGSVVSLSFFRLAYLVASELRLKAFAGPRARSRPCRSGTELCSGATYIPSFRMPMPSCSDCLISFVVHLWSQPFDTYLFYSRALADVLVLLRAASNHIEAEQR